MALSDGLTGYLGPLPVWGWVAIGGAGLFLYEKHKGGASTGSGGLLSGFLGGDTGGSTTADGGTGGTSGSGDVWSSSGATPTAPLTSNTAWGSSAVQALVNAGYDPLAASTAIQNYLGGGQLDPSMSTLVSTAIKALGTTPPEGLIGLGTPAPVMNTPTTPPVTSTTGPAPSSNTSPAKQTTYTVQKGDTQVAIAKKYGISVHDLEQYNKAIQPKGSKVSTGEKLVIPFQPQK